MNTVSTSVSTANGRAFIPAIIILFSISVLSSQPRRGSVVFNSEFGGSLVWDGFALQEKELAQTMELGIIIDSGGVIVDSGGIKYRHWEFGPMIDLAVYILPRLAVGSGYGYAWVDQFLNAHHGLKKEPRGRRLCTSHLLRAQFIYSICLENFDAIDIVGVPFYTFGKLTRIPLPLKIYGGMVNTETLAFFKEMHEPVSYRGYGFEIRVRGRHFLNKYFFTQGSFYTRIVKTHTEKDPFKGLLSNAPQGSFGITLGLGAMLGGNTEREKLHSDKTINIADSLVTPLPEYPR